VEKPNSVIVYGYNKYLLEQSCVIYLTKKQTNFRLLLKLSLLCGSRPKSAMASPKHLAHINPDFIQIGSLWAEL